MKSLRRALPLTALLLVTCLAATSCAPRASQFVREDIDFSFIHRVAVFPFYNLTQDVYAAQRVQSIFVTEVLQRRQLEVVDRGEVLATVAEMKLPYDRILSPEQVKDLGKKLGVDAVFFGTVEEFGLDRAGHDPNNVVTGVYQLCAVENGRTIWSSQVRTDGQSLSRKLFGGGTAAIFEVARANVRAALGTLF